MLETKFRKPVTKFRTNRLQKNPNVVHDSKFNSSATLYNYLSVNLNSSLANSLACLIALLFSICTENYKWLLDLILKFFNSQFLQP